MSYSDIIILNVGGTRFETSRQTLIRFGDSMLAKMFDPESGMEPGIIQNGEYFLDRDPKCFGMILTFLRTGGIPPSVQEDKDLLWGLEKEADYFQLTELQEGLNEMKSKDEIIKVYKRTHSKKPFATVSRAEVRNHPNTLLARVVDDFDLQKKLKCVMERRLWMARHQLVVYKDDCLACNNPREEKILHSCRNYAENIYKYDSIIDTMRPELIRLSLIHNYEYLRTPGA